MLRSLNRLFRSPAPAARWLLLVFGIGSTIGVLGGGRLSVPLTRVRPDAVVEVSSAAPELSGRLRDWAAAQPGA